MTFCKYIHKVGHVKSERKCTELNKAKQMLDKKKTEDSGKLSNTGINLQKLKQREKVHFFFKRIHKFLINVLS
jgi:hypothetical protein